MPPANPPLHAVILAGGSGERFWPASRKARPKQFLRVAGGDTLLEGTLKRARAFAREDRIWIVCGHEHAAAIRKESGLPASRVLVEPRRRNTAMAAAWAAHRVMTVDEDAVMAVLAADHLVPDVRAFARDIKSSARAASRAGALVTLGVEPTRPETGYGYIQSGAAAPDHDGLFQVRRFVEKPDAATARRYLRRGDYRWNAGIFVWQARRLLEEVEIHAPELHRALAPFRRPGGRTRKAVEAAFRKAPSLPVDVAVMERSRRVWTRPVSWKWSDLGAWLSLADELGVGTPGPGPGGESGNRLVEASAAGKKGRKRGGALIEDSRANLVWSNDRLVVLLGVEDLCVVDTEDVTFVTKLDAGSDVRALVAKLRAAGREDLT